MGRTTIGEDFRLINQRQGGRRRGRGGGGRPPSMAQGAGNRQENRQRGNAAQLRDKYRSMARDAQMGGDRVQAEYFLQYADHYFRVLNENRARFEEQRRQRYEGQEGGYEEDEGGEQGEWGPQQPVAAAAIAEDQEDRARDDRDRDERPRHERGLDERGREGSGRGRRGNGDFRARRDERDREDSDREEAEERIAADILPPSIATSEGADEEAEAPRRRGRRPRTPDDEIAPAA
ncbi:MAG: DUF4167 domain-containing protein [Sphingosinicella sp.]